MQYGHRLGNRYLLSGKIWGEGETLCDRDGCWSVACISRRCLSVWIEQKVNLSQSEYSSFHEHLNTSLWGNGPANHSLLHKNKLASSYIDPIVQAFRLVFVPSPHRRTDWSRRYICTHLNYTSFGFTACEFWVCPDVDHAPPPLPVLSVSVWAEGSDWLGAVWPGASERRESCKMAPGRKSETCTRLSVSALGSNVGLHSPFGPASISD